MWYLTGRADTACVTLQRNISSIDNKAEENANDVVSQITKAV